VHADGPASDASPWLDLLDWRRQVAGLYAAVRRDVDDDPVGTLARYRAARAALVRHHPQSPLASEARGAADRGLRWWPYRPDLRFTATVIPARAANPPLRAVSGTGEVFDLVVIGALELPVGRLDVYWVDVYGGGLFLPFVDATAGTSSYGGGRYLLDTVKGADLGGDGRELVVDFNYAYHPSCFYDARWSCPLAPPGNRLAAAIEAGERA
jgi:uncharacterized protein (DUF1684 family)